MIGRVALLVTFKKAKPKSQSLSRSHIRDLPAIRKMKHISLIILTLTFLSCQTKMAVIKQNDKYGLINSKGRVVVEPKWDYILGESEGVYPVELDSLWGYIDRKGNVIIEPKYWDADFFDEGYACVGNSSEKYGFIDKKGDTIIDFLYDESFGSFSKGLADVTLNDSCGYIDKSGKIVIPLIYETCYPFLSDLAVVWTFEGDQKLINKEGETFEYVEEEHKDKKLWSLNTYPGAFKTENGRGRLNVKGDTIIQPNYLSTGNLSDGMHIVQAKNKKWGAYDEKGNLVIEPQFDDLWHFYEGVANFRLKGKYGFANKKGETIINPKFDYASQFNNGLAYVELEGKAGFIDKNGNIVIPIIYEPYRMTRFE